MSIARRKLLAALAFAAAAPPLAARSEPSKRLPTIGVLGAATSLSWSRWVAAFVQRLGELGWAEGRTVAIEYRWAEGHTERFPEIATEFVQMNVDVIVTDRPSKFIELSTITSPSTVKRWGGGYARIPSANRRDLSYSPTTQATSILQAREPCDCGEDAAHREPLPARLAPKPRPP
jgi:hypothetical protein